MATPWDIPSPVPVWSVLFNNHDKSLDIYSNYEKILLAGDFNA